MTLPKAIYSEPTVPLEASKSPDKVLVIGATGHIGRVFLEQGLEMFKTAEFRVLLRNMENAKDLPAGVVCRPGDVRDVQSIRAACESFTRDSLIFDSVTQIALAERDDDGSIAAINLQGVINVIQVAQELGLTLHKAHWVAFMNYSASKRDPSRTHSPITSKISSIGGSSRSSASRGCFRFGRRKGTVFGNSEFEPVSEFPKTVPYFRWIT